MRDGAIGARVTGTLVLYAAIGAVAPVILGREIAKARAQRGAENPSSTVTA